MFLALQVLNNTLEKKGLNKKAKKKNLKTRHMIIVYCILVIETRYDRDVLSVITVHNIPAIRIFDM